MCMGESGNQAALPFLANVAATDDGDHEVHAAAEEAIEKLR
jgi:hypothetical protein